MKTVLLKIQCVLLITFINPLQYSTLHLASLNSATLQSLQYFEQNFCPIEKKYVMTNSPASTVKIFRVIYVNNYIVILRGLLGLVIKT